MIKNFCPLLIFLCTSLSAAQFTAGDGIEILAINGVDTDKLGEKSKKEVEFPPGQHQIVVRYEQDLKRGSNNTLFTSHSYVLSVETGNAPLELSVPKMRFASQAESFFRSPTWTITNELSDKEIQITGDKLEGMKFRGIEDALVTFNRKNSLANSEELVAHTLQKNTPSTSDSLALNQLTHWYGEATNEEKIRFKQWINEQEG